MTNDGCILKEKPVDDGDDEVLVYSKTDLASLIREAQAKCVARLAGGEERGTSQNDEEQPTCFEFDDLIKIQAPMVRCSRPPFRRLCRLYGTSISYTHMIMSESFVRSADARASDFSLFDGEDKLVVQLAGTSSATMAAAAAMVAPYCDAIDINCGCPQKWAMREGIGSALLEKPQQVADMVSAIRNAVPGELVPCVVKMRVYDDSARSVDFARQVEAAGASWVTVHGRTPWDTPSAQVRTSVITLIRDALTVPVVANGSVECPRTAMGLALTAGVGAVMSARGILSNPALFFQPTAAECPGWTFRAQFTPKPFTEHLPTNPASEQLASAPFAGLSQLSSSVMVPVEVISDFVRLAAACELPLKATQHHLLLMAHNYLSPTERLFISQQRSCVGIVRSLMDTGLYTENGKFQFS